MVEELGDEKSKATIFNFIGLFYSFKGNPAQGRKYLEDAFAEAEKIQDIEIMAPVGIGLCVSYMAEGGYKKIKELAPKVITLLEETHREFEFLGVGSKSIFSDSSLLWTKPGNVGGIQGRRAVVRKDPFFCPKP